MCFWIWYNCVRIYFLHTTYCAWIDNREWDKTLRKPLHPVRLKLGTATTVRTFNYLNGVPWLLHMSSCPFCINSFKLILQSNGQCFHFICMAICYGVWPDLKHNFCCFKEVPFLQLDILGFSTRVQMMSKVNMGKYNSRYVMRNWGHLSFHRSKGG